MEIKRTAEAIQLENEIRAHDHAYWILHKPLINDPDYDNIVRRLLKIEPNNVYLQEVRAPKVDSQGKVTLAIPMLSLDKAYEFSEVLKFCKRTARSLTELYKFMFKLDGTSGCLKNKILTTRGDGFIGEDITHKLPFMNILTKGDPEDVRGEILFTKSGFQKIKDIITRKNGEKYKNERNAVGGILTRDDLDPVKILTFVDFEYICKEFTYEEILSIDEDFWNSLIKDAKDSNFPTDGLVIKVSDEDYAKTLGATDHHLKSAISFKFENPHAWSVLRKVEFSPGKHDITPVGKVDPVEISGVVVKSPNLHNWKKIIDMDLQIGDLVKVERAGDVIPDITESKPGENRIPIEIPPCPACGSELVYNDPQLTCPNDECGGKLVNKISDAVIRIGIDRLGKPTIQQMIDTLNVENLIDIFNITFDDLLKLDRFGDKKASNLINEIQKVKSEGVFEWQLLACLNLPGIGRSLSKDLLEDRSLSDLSNLTSDALEKIPSIGPERASVIDIGLLNNSDYLNRLITILPIKENKKVIEGLTKICFSGKFPEKKIVYYGILEKIGGYEIMEKVTDDLDLLVVADSTAHSGKQKSAEKKKIAVIDIHDLMLKLQGE